jgi:hypothetical protein
MDGDLGKPSDEPSDEKKDTNVIPVATLVSDPENTLVAQAVNPTNNNNNNNSSNVTSVTVLPPTADLTSIVNISFDTLPKWLKQSCTYTFYEAMYRNPTMKEGLIGFTELGKYRGKNYSTNQLLFSKGNFLLYKHPRYQTSNVLYYDPTSRGGNKKKSYRRRRVSSKRKSRKTKKSRKLRK